jgi:HAMP domain-containing protein
MFLTGVVLAVLVLLAIFSMLVMARWQEEAQDRLEIELLQEKNFPLS